MIPPFQGGDVPDLARQKEAGFSGSDILELAVAIAGQDMSKAAVEASELRQESEFVAAEDEVGVAIAVEVGDEDGVDRGELHHGGEALDTEVAVAFIKGDNRGAEIECLYPGTIELSAWEEVLDGAFGIDRVFEVLFFEGRDLVFHVVFEKDGHVFTVDGPG